MHTVTPLVGHHLFSALRVALGKLGDAVRKFVADWQLQREAAQIHRALRELDARTLNDLGLHRSEIASLAAEVARRTDRTRVRAYGTDIRRIH